MQSSMGEKSKVCFVRFSGRTEWPVGSYQPVCSVSTGVQLQRLEGDFWCSKSHHIILL